MFRAFLNASFSLDIKSISTTKPLQKNMTKEIPGTAPDVVGVMLGMV